VPGGKADDYYSDVSMEVEVHATLPVDVAADADEETKREAAQRRIDAAVLYLTTYVTKKIDGFFTNLDYGGHAAMVRNRSAEELELVENTDEAVVVRVANEATFEELDVDVGLDRRAAEGIVAGRPFETMAEVDAVPYVGPVALEDMVTWGRARFGDHAVSVRFAVDVAGPNELMTILGDRFDLLMPAGATSDGDGSLGTVRGFDPESYAGELETVPCEVVPIPAARNGYPEYQAFFEDGVFDITLFQGHDYNEARSDLIETLELFWTLENGGFDTAALDYADAPDETVHTALVEAVGEDQAETFADLIDRVSKLHAGSGPLVKTLQVGDREVRAEVRLYHSEMFRTDRAGQRELALSELVTRDVFFYNGHAGPWYGFYLDAAGRAEVHEDDFATATFTGKQQLVVANGCQTYSQYADMLYAHPQKDESNLDVITTVNFSYGRGSDMLVGALTQTDADGRHVAWSYGDLIRAFNQDTVNSENQVFYGVTGIDENPKLHPWSDPANIGATCTSSWDCGNPYGNVCGGTCAAVALSAEGCPEGTTWAAFANGDTIAGGACWR